MHAEGPSLGLDVVYNDYIGKMEKRELKSTMERRFEERFQIPLLAGRRCCSPSSRWSASGGARLGMALRRRWRAWRRSAA